MRVAIFGGSGRLGRKIVEELDKNGHAVQALVRDPKKLDNLVQKTANVKLIRGNPQQEADVRLALAGCEAIVCTLNISRKNDFPWAPLVSPVTLLSDTARTLCRLMPEAKLRRIIVISAWGVGKTRTQLPGWFNWLIEHSNIGPAYEDHARQEDIITASTFDWSILRPVFLSNSKRQEETSLLGSSELPKRIFVSRLSVARSVLAVLDNGLAVREIKTVCRD